MVTGAVAATHDVDALASSLEGGELLLLRVEEAELIDERPVGGVRAAHALGRGERFEAAAVGEAQALPAVDDDARLPLRGQALAQHLEAMDRVERIFMRLPGDEDEATAPEGGLIQPVRQVEPGDAELTRLEREEALLCKARQQFDLSRPELERHEVAGQLVFDLAGFDELARGGDGAAPGDPRYLLV